MVYVPGSKLRIVYAPASFVTLDTARPVALLVAVTMTPGRTAFVASEIVPVSVELLICANAVALNRHKSHVYKIFFIVSTLCGKGAPHLCCYRETFYHTKPAMNV